MASRLRPMLRMKQILIPRNNPSHIFQGIQGFGTVNVREKIILNT
jgi:hypothetical protein